MGVIFFNLAEHRDHQERPFAFLATYAVPKDSEGQLVHVPLGKVVRDEAQKSSREALLQIFGRLEEVAKSCSWLTEMVNSRRIFQPQSFSAGEAYRMLQDIPLCEAAGIRVRVPDWWGRGKTLRPQVKVELGAGPPSRVGGHGLVDFKLSIALGDDKLSEEEWQTLLVHAEGLIKIRGRWVEVDREALRQVHGVWGRALAMSRDGGIPFGAAMRYLVGARPKGIAPASDDSGESGLPQPGDQRVSEWSQVTAGPWLKDALAGLRQPEILQVGEHEPGVRATLRPYQIVGLNWLWHLYGLSLGGCLADDMGLGKTLQVLALLSRVKRLDQPRNPSLLVVPASLLGNWCDEAGRFTPHLTCRVVHPSFSEGIAPLDEGVLPDVVLTTYGLITRLSWLRDKQWNIVILDEAQAIKNPGTQQTVAVKSLQSQCRIALTGTPVENRLSDLWSLFDFACPSLLGSWEDFRQLTVATQTQAASDSVQDPTSMLRRLVSPYILRRLKTDQRIIADLPPKTEMLVWCPLMPRQAALYAAEVAALKKDLESLADEQSSPVSGGFDEESALREEKHRSRRRGVILAYLTRFKQICNHPAQAMGIGSFSHADSGKLQRLCDLAEEIAASGEKLLVFTQFQAISDMLSKHLAEIFGREGLVLTGRTAVQDRKKMVHAFQSPGGPPFFVLSLKAGGTGLNLTAASHVIHFDRWWNPAVENQATDRAFRIGQNKRVLVHKFVCRGTIEEKIARMIDDKSQLARSILEGGQPSEEINITELSDEAILDLVTLDLKTIQRESDGI